MSKSFRFSELETVAIDGYPKRCPLVNMVQESIKFISFAYNVFSHISNTPFFWPQVRLSLYRTRARLVLAFG
jgi:hypothetical protein